MKYTAIVVALLVNNNQAIRVRDIGDLELPALKDDNDVKLAQDIEDQAKKF